MVKPHLTNTRLRLKAFNCYKSFDVESLLFTFFLFLVGRTASFLAQHILAILISITSVFSVVLILGAKLSQLCTTTIEHKNSNLLRIALTPIFGTGFVYLTWMGTASFSNFAPVVSLILILFCILLSPKLYLGRKIGKTIALLIVEFKKGRRVHTILFILQLVLMTSVSYELSNSSNNIWLKTIYDGLPLWIYVCIFATFLITFMLSLFNSKLWFISIFVLGIWVRTFMLSRGFVHFGGDDGENIAVVKFLANGGTTPFLDLHVSENYWNWRYGSFHTLCFQSNMAFISVVANIPLDFTAGSVAVVVSILLMIIGGFALSKAVLKSGVISKLALTLMLIFSTPGFWWQFRFDPNLLTHTLFLAYLTAVLLLPTSKTGFFLLLFSTLVMASTHPTALALVLPCIFVKLAVFFHKIMYGDRMINKKRVLMISFLVLIAAVMLVAIPNLAFLVLRMFSATHLFGLSPGESVIIGNYLFKSMLINYWYNSYTLVFLFVLYGIIFLIPFWNLVKSGCSDKVKALIAIVSMIAIELLIFDFFTSADPFPAWRLWALLPTLLIPIISLVFSVVVREKPSMVHTIKILSKRLFSIQRNALPKMMTVIALSMITTLSFVQTAYPVEQALNLDTISKEELNLLSKLSSIDLNRSLILAESPTWRYILGILGDWPPTTATYYSKSNNWPALYYHPWGLERIKAFTDLVYYGKIGRLVDLATRENATAVYVVVLNRYAGEKVITWYGGKPYVEHLKSFGQVAFTNSAGYILKINLSDFRVFDVPLAGWKIVAAIGVTDPVLRVEDYMLCIGATFSDRYQCMIAAQDFALINLTEYRFLSLQYKGDGHSWSPHLRIFLRDSKNSSIELLPVLFSSDEFTTVMYDLQNISIKDVVSVSVHIDSGSPATKWSGPGTYFYYIKNLQFATWG